MAGWEIRSESAAIVLLGSFNPRIFHPEWFIRKGLVSEDWDYAASTQEQINFSEVSQFTFPTESVVQVLTNRFIVRSASLSEQLVMQDLVAGTFTILSETPVQKMGMNYEMVAQIADKTTWKRLGHELAPKQHWLRAAESVSPETYKEEENREQALQTFGLFDMTMHMPRSDSLDGFMRAKIEITPPLDKLRLKLSMNNHIELGAEGGVEAVPTILNEKWTTSLKDSKTFFSHLLSSLTG